MPKKNTVKKPKRAVRRVKTVPKGGFIWLSGWNWSGEDGFSNLNFGERVEIRCLRLKRGSNELYLLLWSTKFDEGTVEMGFHTAKKRYPSMF